MTATRPGDGYYAPGSCPICHAAPDRPHEDDCPVPIQKWEAEHDAPVQRP